ncbi:MAG TPA: hypothetical protein DCP69_04440 [Candidatus Omnitrophica bacterium]|nr:hypothetical protein [Candidatus Omnitrophota bacterium]
MKRNQWGGLMAEEPGGYMRDNAGTFGAGTLGRCDHDWWKKCETYWVQQMIGGHRIKTFSLSHPDDKIGDRRCRKCAAKEEP